jgi:uncharacterized protein
MLKVKTYLDKSPIEGFGLFAAEEIPKGTVVWELSPLDIVISKEMLKKLPEVALNYIHKHAIMDKQFNQMILSFDNDRFTNHSNNPNTRFHEQTTVARKDIQVGEEITIDYYEIDDYADYKLNNLLL